MQKDPLTSAKRRDKMLINEKKIICLLVDFAILTDNKVKMKESKKIDKYLDLGKNLEKLWNMKVTVTPIVIDAFETVPKSLEKRLGKWKSDGKSQEILEVDIIKQKKGKVRKEYFEEK